MPFGWVAAATAAASAVVSGVGAMQGAKAASSASKFNAQVAAQNAEIAQQNANWASEEGEVNAATKSMQNRAEMGDIKSSQAANGIDVNSGSAAQVQQSQAELGQMDVMNIRANAARQAYGYITQKQGALDQAALDRASAKSANKAGTLAAVSTVLGVANKSANSYTNYQRKGSLGAGDNL